jgi:hypothetical protein
MPDQPRPGLLTFPPHRCPKVRDRTVHQVISPEEGIDRALQLSDQGPWAVERGRAVHVSCEVVVEGIVEPQKVEADAAE